MSWLIEIEIITEEYILNYRASAFVYHLFVTIVVLFNDISAFFGISYFCHSA